MATTSYVSVSFASISALHKLCPFNGQGSYQTMSYITALFALEPIFKVKMPGLNPSLYSLLRKSGHANLSATSLPLFLLPTLLQ